MKTPQLENGYTRIANELLANLIGEIHLSGNEWKVLLTIIRKTYGYQKTSDKISLTQFEKLTNISRPSVVEAISKLVGKNLLVVKKEPFINEFSLNKDVKSWLTSRDKGTSRVFGFKLVGKKEPKLVGKKEHTKERKKYTKEILLRNSETFGNTDINQLIEHFKKTMEIPKEDCTQRQSRQYWNLLLKESRTGIAGVKWLIGLAKADEFYSNNITSSKSLYYARVKLITRQRGNRPKIAVFGGVKNE